MAKNMTRKSLAIGAAVALGGSLFAAAPAHAVTSLTISPGSGTSYNTILGSSLNLSAVLVSDDVTPDMIKWKIDGIENDKLNTETRSVLSDSAGTGYEDAREIDYGTTTFNRAVTVFQETTGVVDSTVVADGYTSASGSVGSTAGLETIGDDIAVVEDSGATDSAVDGDTVFVNDYATPGATDDTFTVAPYAVFDWSFPNTKATVDGATAYEATVDTTPATIYTSFIDGHYNEDELAQLRISAAAAEVADMETLEFTVQAWVDSTPNNQIDPGETVSVEETVKFVAYDEVVAGVGVDVDLGGQATVAVVLDDINNEQNDTVHVALIKDGSYVNLDDADDVADLQTADAPEYMVATYDSDEGAHVIATTALGATAGVFRAEAFTTFVAVDENTDGDLADGTDEQGQLGATSGTEVVFAGDADATNGSDWDVINNANVAMADTNEAIVRTGETVELAYEVLDADDFGVDGVNVRFTIDIDDVTLEDADSVINVGSAVVDQDAVDAGDDIELFAVTDDDGIATLTFSGGVEGDIIDVIAVYEGTTGYTDAESIDVVFQDTYATTLVQLNSLSTTDEILVDASEEVTLSFVVHDQWSTPFDEDNFEIEVAWTDEDDDTNNDYTDEISGGLASFDITAPSAAGTYDILASVYDNGNDTFEVSADAGEVELAIDLNVTDGTPTTVTVGGDEDSVSVAGVPLGAYDNRIAQSSPYADALASSVFTVTVRDEFGVPMQGQTVTVSAAGLGFTAATTAATGLTAGGLNTFSAETNSSGEVEFTAYSNTAAEELMISVTAGAVSTEAEVTFTGISTVFPGSGLSLDVAETVMSGTANDVVVTLTDELGNPIEDVDVTLDATGVGYLQDEVKTTNSQGQINTKLIIGSNESGSATITATVVLADDESTPADEEGTTLTVSTTISVGYGTVSAWTKDMGDGTAKVYVKFPTIGEKVRIGHQTGGSGSYETIFVKTITSQTDSALVVNANGSYIVRTIDLEDINRIRVTVGDDTLVQVRYNQ